ncbi:outer membrane lipoprotein-sorting protein [Sulfuriferula plumbiphila]|uniref:Outer membrane lipoprotein-sorting protein n=1 Tax=Sulfuriferula plumbiphila TaxID=171865 RepID=A0A512LA45_9PROT|nr:outer membrane lipoprotein-sorting protein [Sulfuriferula plumbiphila]BBP05685.1 outer membrane lipoprotein-sorting protein [Sulfuriferula plumbiphila]GEP31353.1 outer membrane lipoprotein-sorting protein [Sulfuriferula plumbiphila]
MSMTSLFRAGFLTSFLILALAGITAAAEPLAAEDSLARSILEKSDEIRFPSHGFQVDVDIASSTPGAATEKRKYRILSKGNDNTLVMILEPASERGQIMLMKGRDLWVFMPDVSQPIRLGLAQRLTGQVANGDLARANFTGDYTPKLLRIEKREGEDYYVLELRAVDRGVTYHRVLLWVNKSSYRPRQAEFYSLSGRLLKTCSYENFETMAGKQRPTRMLIQDALKSGDTSVLEYGNMRLRDLPDKVFSKDYLKKLQ